MRKKIVPMFVTVRLMGGLGNQLFQIFTMMAYSLQYGHSTILWRKEKLENRSTYWETMFSELQNILTTNSDLSMFKVYSEPFYHYNALPQISTDFELYGYFQSPRYFSDYEDLIYQKLHLQEKQKDAQLLFSSSGTVAMHFRLGDYKNLPEYHPILPLLYYEKALAKLTETYPTVSQVLCFFEEEDGEFVFRERIQPLQTQFPLLEFLRIDTSISEWQQLLIMSGCQHFIIANSTFSWWGAYLGTTLNKKTSFNSQIYYPQTWFGPALGDKYVQDLFPPHWNCIK